MSISWFGSLQGITGQFVSFHPDNFRMLKQAYIVYNSGTDQICMDPLGQKFWWTRQLVTQGVWHENNGENKHTNQPHPCP